MSPAGTVLSKKALKASFVISSMGATTGETRRRADYVLDNFIKPACLLAGYDAKRSDELDDPDIGEGIQNSLMGSPMAVAYLGGRFNCQSVSPCMIPSAWNDSVMVEVGYRLAAQLPLVFVCDDLPGGANLGLPPMLGVPRTVMIPCGKDELDPEQPQEKAKIDRLVKELVKRIRYMEADGPIGSEHAVALVHSRTDEDSDPSDPGNMFFVGASPLATELFGFEDSGNGRVRLAGRNMNQFLDTLKYRMPIRQYGEFLESQNQARSTWTGLTGPDPWRTPTVHIPIVFDRHPRRQFVGRAYLPIIVNKFNSGNSWSTLRVLYLDVTSVTEEQKDGNQSIFTCEIDPRSSPLKLPAPPEPLNVFLCHNSMDKPVVETLLNRLAELSPLSVNPWVDKSGIAGGERFVDAITSIVLKADVAFVFLGNNGEGPYQEQEIQLLVNQTADRTRKKLVILPILLGGIDQAQLKTLRSWLWLSTMSNARLDEVDSDQYLIHFFDAHFPGRLTL